MSNFDEDPELEEKLQQDPRELNEDDLQEVQIYKSQKLQALRDAGESGDKPEWWKTDHAPENLDELAGTVSGDGEVASDDSDAGEEESAEETEEAAEESEEPQEEVTEEEPEEEAEDQPEPETEEPAETPGTSAKTEPSSSKGVPQVGWSSGVPKTDEVDFDNELLEGIYQRQDELMNTLQAVNQGMSEVDVGGEAIESIQQSLDELNDKVDALSEDQDDEFRQKVDEIHEVISTTRDMESKLSELSALPDEEELVEAGIIDSAVEHDGSDSCFRTSIDGRKAALHYGDNPDRLTAYHYSLPSVLSESARHAIEDVLAKALFEYADEQGKMVHPQQPRIRSGFLARHPEYYSQTPRTVREQMA
ncbi:MAG: hypothetical protein ABEK50_17635 [bacterium]